MAMQRTTLFRQNFEEDFPFIFRFPDGKRPEYPWKIVFNTYEGPNKSRISFTALSIAAAVSCAQSRP